MADTKTETRIPCGNEDHDAEPVYLVWSHEHHVWWGPNFSLYTSDVWKAGRYDEAKARDASGRRSWSAPDMPADVMVLAPENNQRLFSLDAIRAVPDLMRSRIDEATRVAVAARKVAAEHGGEVFAR